MFGEKTEVAVLDVAGVSGPLEGFVAYLREQRGVSPLTISAYVADVDRFLAGRCDGRLLELTASEVSKAVLGEMAARSLASVRRYGCALRSFLRYCQMAELVKTDLSAAVLPVSGRRRSLLPCGINEAQAIALLAACDRQRRWDGGTTRWSCYFFGSGCVRPRSRRCGPTSSTGVPDRSKCMARADASMSCRSRLTSGRRSPAICATAAPVSRSGKCSYA